MKRTRKNAQDHFWKVIINDLRLKFLKMTKSQHEALIKFNQVSRQREICDEKAKMIKRYRNLAIYFFLVSIALIVAYQFVAHSAIFQTLNVNATIEATPGTEYLFLALGILSFIALLVSVLRSINAEMHAEKARMIEGKMAERAFALMFVKTKRN